MEGETPTTPAAPTQADRDFDPTPQTAPVTTPAVAPAEPTAPVSAEPAPAEPGPAPWAESLAKAFEDETQRNAVDAYLRAEVQPHVTQLEQQYGDQSKVFDQLWDDDQQKSLGTYLALTEARFGPEVALAVANSIQEQLAGTPEGVEPGTDTTVDPPDFEDWLAQQPVEMQPIYREQYETREDAEYEATILKPAYEADWTTQAQSGQLFSHFVVETEGNLQEALSLWETQMKPIIEKNPEAFGFQKAEEATPEATAVAAATAAQAAAPAEAVVLGTGATSQGVTTPPVVPTGDTLDQAIDSFYKDLHAPVADVSRGF